MSINPVNKATLAQALAMKTRIDGIVLGLLAIGAVLT